MQSSIETENNKKFKLTANNINSIDISITIIFFLFKKIPQIPNKKSIIETVRYRDKSIIFKFIILYVYAVIPNNLPFHNFPINNVYENVMIASLAKLFFYK